ncbi:elongation factor P maturation arginine rhamnosyltransferase EarP [Rhodoferax sp.]|uniref:elongation factor P maturation arginine rhamnosyltransferase EarP n=1 Tax=Rhodoferax sp. TaxID=50421 RepID=UPI0025F4DF03|nr:elongation factor P maturation arginine rhamnosyltransferase EarP [Rhodoferax sp.]
MSLPAHLLPPDAPLTNLPHSQWEVFCRVIDNFGDIGVCWRLCADLASRGHHVRLWADDSSPLQWMAPGALEGTWPGVQVLDWALSHNSAYVASLPPATVWIEGFGCEIAPEFIAACADFIRAGSENHFKPPVWINLEYLSAESYVERCHALPSPVMQGPAKGWTKNFYYPGFTQGTGGLLREPALLQDEANWGPTERTAWLQVHGVAWQGERLISLFCYEPPALGAALAHWMAGPEPTLLLVTPGRATRAVKAIWTEALAAAGLQDGQGHLRVHYLPLLSQTEFDGLLGSCDVNLVRGEDSLVRALWAGKPFIWNIYPQDDGAHADKLQAFLDCLNAPPSLRALHGAWNGVALAGEADGKPWDWNTLHAAEMLAAAQNWRSRLMAQPDLVSQLLNFVEKKR